MRRLVGIILLCVVTQAWARKIVVPLGTFSVEGFQKGKQVIFPGDTIALEPGNRDALRLHQIVGSPGHYVTVINNSGLVNIYSTITGYGISATQSRYLRIMGNSNPAIKYGITVAGGSHHGAIGLNAQDKTSDIEVAWLEITNVGGPGIMIKTDPTTAINKDNFTIYNVKIHNCYVHHVGCEGFYIGCSFFMGKKVKTGKGDSTIMVLPPRIVNAQIYNNLVTFTGWDGIQISDVIHAHCYNNTVLYDSRKALYGQQSSYMIGSGSSGIWENNIGKYGLGNTVECFGIDTVIIRNNTLITNDSAKAKYAVYLNDKNAIRPTVYIVNSNVIKSTRAPAIQSVNRPGISKTLKEGNVPPNK